MVVFGIMAFVVLGGGNAKADFTFGEPTNLGPVVNSSANDHFPCISPDGLTLYFQSGRSDPYGGYGIWSTTRNTTDDEWAEPVKLGPTVNSATYNGGASISADRLSLFLHSPQSGVVDL